MWKQQSRGAFRNCTNFSTEVFTPSIECSSISILNVNLIFLVSVTGLDIYWQAKEINRIAFEENSEKDDSDLEL